MIYPHILATIGKTPIVSLNKLKNLQTKNAWAKLEYFNPGGSVKDRPALNMIETAEKNGQLQKGQKIVEPTSGNTGIGLAMVGAVKGYETLFIMPESMSEERRKILMAYGAEIQLTPAEEGMGGAIAQAEKLVKERGYFMPSQFTNPANPEAHIKSTALEIWEDTEGKLDVIILGIGTGGTITGIGKALKSKKPDLKIIAVEPKSSAVLSGKEKGHHAIQGIGAGFVPDILDTEIYDEIFQVSDEEAISMMKFLSTKEGVFCGISSGAAVHALHKVAQRSDFKDQNILAILPDTGERYLSML